MERALLEKDWPKDLRSKSPNETVQVERKGKAIGSCVVQTREPFIDYARFSKYSRLLRTVAWIRRFIRNSKLKEEERLSTPLTGLEIREAEQWLIANVQKTSFDEVASLVKHGGPLKDSKLANLNPFLCPTSGLLRVGGRTHKSSLPEGE